MSLRERHRDVAAYALGVLEPGDAFRCEEHLEGCPRCARWLTEFARLERCLAELREPVRPLAPPPLTRRARPRPRSRARLVAVAAALILAMPAAGLALREGDAPPAASRASVTDPVTGVAVAASWSERPWGTDVAMRVSGVDGPRVCDLVVVGRDGREHPVMSWWVPARGQDSPVVEGATALPAGEIDRLVVRERGGGALVSLTP
ncbi:zf-HC2 domain-containing protein [Streptomyces purpureus]|uniref:zf-HC2 domain-containing protein n=1 Tax=Streptomyces purpureus TaxID=1951 RepID=UPI0037900DBF